MRLLLSLMTILAAACVPPQSSVQPPGGDPYAPGYASAGSFGGAWVTQGGTMTLQDQNGQVSGTIQGDGLQGSVQGVARGNQLDGTFTMADGSSGRFVATTDGNQLTIDIGGPQPLVFTRSGAYAAQPGGASQGGDAPPPGAPPPSYPPQAAPSPPPPGAGTTAGTVPAFVAKAATGAPVYDQYKGWEVKTPAGWKHGIQDGKLVFGSDTEAGIIFVAFFDNVTFEQAAAAIDGQIRGLGATPIGSPRSAAVKAGRALIAELSGNVNGSAVQGRAVGVAGPAGMLVVLGFSTVDKFKTLRRRVDALAQSTRFFTPERGQVGLVSGCFRSSSGGSATWVERTLYFDGAGRFSRSGFVASHSTDASGRFTGSSASLQSSGNGGTYVVQGSNAIRLRWDDGSTSAYELVYEHGAVGALKSGNTWYLRCN